MPLPMCTEDCWNLIGNFDQLISDSVESLDQSTARIRFVIIERMSSMRKKTVDIESRLQPENQLLVGEFFSDGIRSEFVSFVHFVIGQAKNGKPLKIHWRPQNVICRPCHVSYDFIGRYESLYQDADFVLNRIGHASPKPDDAADSNITLSSMQQTNEVSSHRKLKFPRFDRDIRQTNSKHLVENMMTLLSPSDIRELYRLYELDFRLYGYESKT